MDKLELDKQYMRIAQLWANNSKARRMKVGAIIVKDRTMIADGFNGTPAGFDNNCEYANGKTLPHVLHAEANAIAKIAQSTLSSKGATIYTSVSPCVECAKLIIQAGITRVVYAKFHKPEGIALLSETPIEIIHLKW